MINKKALLISTLTALTISFSAVADKPIYKWKDSQGNIKYTQSKPPRGTDYEAIYQNTSKKPPEDNANSDTESSITAEQDDILAQQQAEKQRVQLANEEIRRKNCEIAKNNMQSLETNQRIMIMEDGKEKMISGEDRIARLNTAKGNVAKYCN